MCIYLTFLQIHKPMAYDYQIAKMITSKLLKVKLKSNTRKENEAFLFLKILNIPLGIFSDMITKLNYSHTTHVNMGFDETKM